MSNGEERETYDYGGIISILFAVTIVIIVLASAFDFATISGNLARIIDVIIGYLLGRFTTVN